MNIDIKIESRPVRGTSYNIDDFHIKLLLPKLHFISLLYWFMKLKTKFLKRGLI